MQDRLRDKVHLQTVQILEREDALTPRMEEAGEAPPRHTPRPPTRGADFVFNRFEKSHVTTRQGLSPNLPTNSTLPWSESPDVSDVLRMHISHGSCAAGGEYQLALVNGLATVPTAMPKG